jgi:diacylglycerol O-acyltransferase
MPTAASPADPTPRYTLRHVSVWTRALPRPGRNAAKVISAGRPSDRAPDREPGDRPVRSPLHREVALGLAVFGLYVVVAAATGEDRYAAAERHGRQILGLERALRVAAEEPLNAWLAPHPVLSRLANYEYAYGYLITAAAMLVWLYLRRPAEYRWARGLFLVVNGVGITCFALYPLTPPRLLPDEGFVDTVRLGHTFGSWGSPLVDRANHVAAMPSLHVAWGLWVVIALVCVSSPRWLQVAAASHVALTTVVIMATANHYLLDAVGGAAAVGVAYGLTALVADRPGIAPRVAGGDVLFLHAESPAAPQHVAGLLVMRDSVDGAAYAGRLRARIEANLHRLPRLRQRLYAPPSRWRRPRWVPAPDLDWAWHTAAYDLTGPDGRPGGAAALDAFVAELQAAPLPRDRPLWRFVTVTGAADGEVAAILVVHHAVADGMAMLAIAAGLLEPEPVFASGPVARPGGLRRVLGVVIGLAQLAGDGVSPRRLPSAPVPTRRFGTAAMPLALVRDIADTHRAHVSDVLLSAVAGATRRLLAGSDPIGGLRVSVPRALRAPTNGQFGNLTAGVMVDLPLAPMPEVDRLAETSRRGHRLRSGSRALAGRFVTGTVLGALPAPAQAWFAHTVYGHRFFQAIVTNIPGPAGSHYLAGAPVLRVYPIVPLAPGAPLAVGLLGWGAGLFVGVSSDAAFIDDADRLASAVRAVIEELAPTPDRPDRPGSGSPIGRASAEAW